MKLPDVKTQMSFVFLVLESGKVSKTLCVAGWAFRNGAHALKVPVSRISYNQWRHQENKNRFFHDFKEYQYPKGYLVHAHVQNLVHATEFRIKVWEQFMQDDLALLQQKRGIQDDIVRLGSDWQKSFGPAIRARKDLIARTQKHEERFNRLPPV